MWFGGHITPFSTKRQTYPNVCSVHEKRQATFGAESLVGLCKWLRSIHTSYKLEKREKEIGYKTSLVHEEYVYTQINVGCIWTVFCIYANGIHSIWMTMKSLALFRPYLTVNKHVDCIFCQVQTTGLSNASDCSAVHPTRLVVFWSRVQWVHTTWLICN